MIIKGEFANIADGRPGQCAAPVPARRRGGPLSGAFCCMEGYTRFTARSGPEIGGSSCRSGLRRRRPPEGLFRVRRPSAPGWGLTKWPATDRGPTNLKFPRKPRPSDRPMRGRSRLSGRGHCKMHRGGSGHGASCLGGPSGVPRARNPGTLLAARLLRRHRHRYRHARQGATDALKRRPATSQKANADRLGGAGRTRHVPLDGRKPDDSRGPAGRGWGQTSSGMRSKKQKKTARTPSCVTRPR